MCRPTTAAVAERGRGRGLIDAMADIEIIPIPPPPPPPLRRAIEPDEEVVEGSCLLKMMIVSTIFDYQRGSAAEGRAAGDRLAGGVGDREVLGHSLVGWYLLYYMDLIAVFAWSFWLDGCMLSGVLDTPA